MFSTILPQLITLTVFILTLLCLLAGNSPGYLQDYALLTVNATALKSFYHANAKTGLPIHDSYSMFMRASCAGYYSQGTELPIQGATCSEVSSDAKFLPGSLITNDLTAHKSPANLTSLNFPQEIDRQFSQHYNPQLHAALVFYILTLVFVGFALCWGCLAFCVGALAGVNVAFVSIASTFLLIASVLTTVTESQATSLINDLGAPNVTASYNSNFLKLTWAAFGLNWLSIIAWSAAAAVSAAL